MIIKLEDLLKLEEGQIFDRKSARLDPKDIGNVVIAFANADGGKLAIGLEEDKTPTGFKNLPNRENKIKETFSTWILPPPRYSFSTVGFTHPDGAEDHVLIIDIEQSNELHKNRKDEVYLRCGRQTRKLNFEERQQLLYDKGLQRFEVSILDDAKLEDLDLDLLKKYGGVINITNPEKILLARNLAELKDGKLKLNYAGILLFGKEPQRWIDLARVRVLRYEGTSEDTGERLNLTKDEKITGPVIKQIENTKGLIDSILRDFTQLDSKTGKFITIPEYPPFVWLEAIVNAVTHREYSIFGSDILVKLFDDHLEVISPGNFPSIVREHNIKNVHFSRNPKIARVLADLDYVKELGEGVDRMYQEMHKAGLPEPVFKGSYGAVSVKLYNKIQKRRLRKEVDLLSKIKHDKLTALTKDERNAVFYVVENNKITTKECAKLINKSDDTALNVLKKLTTDYNPPFLIDRRKFLQDPKAYYEINPEIFTEQKQIKEEQITKSQGALEGDQPDSQSTLL